MNLFFPTAVQTQENAILRSVCHLSHCSCGIIGLLFLSMLVLWPFTRHGHWIAWVISLVNFAFLTGVGVLFSGGTDLLIFFKAMPSSTSILFALPWISGIMTLGLCIILVQVWRGIKKYWWSKIHDTLVTVGSAALFWLANYWNLILF